MKNKINCNKKDGIEKSFCKMKKDFCEHKSTEFSSAVKKIISSNPKGAIAVALYEIGKETICSN